MTSVDVLLAKTASFFRRLQWKEIVTFLLFVLLSFVFWLMQNYDKISFLLRND
jgi:hypothetical protein